jgi:hypothetical protein
LKIQRTGISVLLLLALLVCLVLSPCSALAEDGEAGQAVSAQQTASMTFTNEAPDTPSLYVSKQIENLSEVPEGQSCAFTFRLLLDGTPAKELDYLLLNADGKVLYNYGNGDVVPTEEDLKTIPLERKTTRDGLFTLQADQTAVFQELELGGSYEVEELATENFIQVQPAGGLSAVGTLSDLGDSVVFQNLYTPPNPPDPNGAEGTLVVRKAVIFPTDYALPNNATFTFQLKIGGEAWLQEAFEIYDSKTGLKVGDGLTDRDGQFQLEGGQQARFTNIPIGEDYEVSEGSLPEGWRVIGDGTVQGATGNLVQVPFTNACASFVVTKRMLENAESDATFEFQLTDEAGNPWRGAQYYLYQLDGTKVHEDDKLYKTDKNGKFSLQAEQAAVFIGIEPGTVYNVQEVANPAYEQKVPTTPEGYTNKTVLDSLEVLPFINEYQGDSGTLAVTKLVQDQAGKAGDVFTFRLYRDSDNDGIYEPYGAATYTVKELLGTSTYQTDSDGYFTLKANQTARFANLINERSYMVKEVKDKMPEGYSIADADKLEQTGILQEGLSFTFLNIYKYGPEMPNTGGIGLAVVMVVGIAAIGCGVALKIKRR